MKIRRNKSQVVAVAFMATFSTIYPAHSASLDLSKISVLSSENISTASVDGHLEVYLNSFRPDTKIFFKVPLHHSAPPPLFSHGRKLDLAANGTFQFSTTSGSTLDQSSIKDSIRTFTDPSGTTILKVLPTPPDFPITSFTGDTSLIAKKQINRKIKPIRCVIMAYY